MSEQMPLNSTFKRAINIKGGMCCPWVALKAFEEFSLKIQAADEGNTQKTRGASDMGVWEVVEKRSKRLPPHISLKP